jgi:hypothetical protein
MLPFINKKILLLALWLWVEGCSDGTKQASTDYAIASTDYAVLAQKAICYQADFQLENWAEMLADSVQGSFPESHAKLNGKKELIAYWQNWKTSNHIRSVAFSGFNVIPLHSSKSMKNAGLSGVYVLLFCTNTIVKETGEIQQLNINFCCHFNQQKLIDRYDIYSNQSEGLLSKL